MPDTVILGAGAAGMFCAGVIAARGGKVTVIDHARAPGEKIRISGGGRCNFTNLGTGPANFLSANPHFCKSALARYTQWDFLDLVARHGIAWHEKTLGQLFCDGSAKQIIAMLRDEMRGADLRLGVAATEISHRDGAFHLNLSDGTAMAAANLVIATGGKSIPKMGATGFGYDIARRFGLPVTETRAGLVPLTFGPQDLAWMAPLAGLATEATVTAGAASFTEGLLFTHRGLSGPSILQASNYWREGDPVAIRFADPDPVLAALQQARSDTPKRAVQTVLSAMMPNRLAQALTGQLAESRPLGALSDATLRDLAARLAAFPVRPAGSEGYRTAEVTLGGVDTDALDARTMQARAVPGLYFIGEVVDVTGWLGGYNFQWAWASAHAAGTAIAA